MKVYVVSTLALEGSAVILHWGASISNLAGDVAGVHAVIHAPTASDHFQWVQAAKGGDIFVPVIPPPPIPGLSRNNDVSDLCKTILDGIIKREMEYGS